MITSPQNEKLKLVRKLRERKHREREGLFVDRGRGPARGRARRRAPSRASCSPPAGLPALGGEEVEPELLAAVSALGSGTRAIAVWPLRWATDAGARPRLRLPARRRRPRQRRRDRPHRPRAARRHRRARPRLRRPLLAEGGAGQHGLDLRASRRVPGRGRGDAGAAGRPRRPRRRGARARSAAPATICLGAEREGLPRRGARRLRRDR